MEGGMLHFSLSLFNQESRADNCSISFGGEHRKIPGSEPRTFLLKDESTNHYSTMRLHLVSTVTNLTQLISNIQVSRDVVFPLFGCRFK